MASKYHVLPQDPNNAPEKSKCCVLNKRKILVLIVFLISLGFVCLYALYHRPILRNNSDYRKDLLSSDFNKARHRLPKCIIIGMRKGGTRALLHFLSLHPDVQVSTKEIHYFDKNENYFEGEGWYRKHLPMSYGDQLTIEKTPGYFHSKDAPERIFQFNSTIKLILIVREPVDRAVSDHLQLMDKKTRRGKETFSFEDMALTEEGEINTSYKPIERSVYYNFMKKWLKFFQLEQILIVDGKKLTRNPFEVVQKVESYLGLPHKIKKESFVFDRTKGFFCIKNEMSGHRCLNKTKGRKHPELDNETVAKLKEYFKPYNTMFFDQVGQTFKW